jgi:hypothetical protein
MFVVMGVLLLGYGLLGDRAVYARSLGLNINAIWGGVMVVTGAILLALSRASRHVSAPADGDDRS